MAPNTDYLTYDDLEGIGFDLSSILSSVTNAVNAANAPSTASANAKAAAAAAAAEQARTQAILSGNASSGQTMKILMYVGLAAVAAYVVIGGKRSVQRRRRR